MSHDSVINFFAISYNGYTFFRSFVTAVIDVTVVIDVTAVIGVTAVIDVKPVIDVTAVFNQSLSHMSIDDVVARRSAPDHSSKNN